MHQQSAHQWQEERQGGGSRAQERFGGGFGGGEHDGFRHAVGNMYNQHGRGEYLNALRNEQMNDEMMQRLGFGSPALENGQPQGMSQGGGNPYYGAAGGNPEAAAGNPAYGGGAGNPDYYGYNGENSPQSNQNSLSQMARGLSNVWNQYENTTGTTARNSAYDDPGTGGSGETDYPADVQSTNTYTNTPLQTSPAGSFANRIANGEDPQSALDDYASTITDPADAPSAAAQANKALGQAGMIGPADGSQYVSADSNGHLQLMQSSSSGNSTSLADSYVNSGDDDWGDDDGD